MGDTKNEILDAVKLLLGIKENDKDDVLMLLIEDTVNSVLAYCRIDVLPRQIVSFIPTLRDIRQIKTAVLSRLRRVRGRSNTLTTTMII